MAELVRWRTDDGGIVVEVDEDDPGYQLISRKPGELVAEAGRKFEDALAGLKDAAASALKTFRDSELQPDEVEIEFGVKLNASVGAVIAKSTIEGHLVVRLTWNKPEQ